MIIELRLDPFQADIDLVEALIRFIEASIEIHLHVVEALVDIVQTLVVAGDRGVYFLFRRIPG